MTKVHCFAAILSKAPIAAAPPATAATHIQHNELQAALAAGMSTTSQNNAQMCKLPKA